MDFKDIIIIMDITNTIIIRMVYFVKVVININLYFIINLLKVR